MNDLGGMLCLGSVFLVPLLAFFMGYMIGADKLPFKVRVERNKRARFAVEDHHDETPWK